MADSLLTDLPALTAPDKDDPIYITDDPASTPLDRKITLENLWKVINTFTAEASPVAGDYVSVYDTSASAARRVLVSNILAVSHNHAASEVASGTLTHERGGLEADVSAYSGLVKITGGATSAVTVTTFAETVLDDANAAAALTTLGAAAAAHDHEGTAILSTGETGGTKFLREDGDGTCSWQAGAGGGSGDFLADGSVAMTGDINADGNNIDNGGVVFLKEQAAADADVAGSGQIWVKTATPNQLWFTNDAGTDTQLGTSASSSSAWYDNTDGATITIDGANGKRQMVTLGGNRNIEWTGLTEGDAILLRVIQDGTGSRLVSSWGSNATINWPGATNPTLTTTASQIDILGFLVIDATTDAEVIEAVTVAQNIAP